MLRPTTLVRVGMCGGLEPFVFVKSIFILFSFLRAKKSPDPNGSSVWQSLRLRRIVLPTGDCAVWWKAREAFTLDTYVRSLRP